MASLYKNQLSLEDKVWVDPLPFDSYSPLYNNPRGRGIGGFKRFDFGGYYGCCACIAAAGVAVFPLCAALKGSRGPVLNGLLPGVIEDTTPEGQNFTLRCESRWPVEADFTAAIELDAPELFTLTLRVPGYVEGARVCVNGEPVPTAAGYVTVTRLWKTGDTVTLTGSLPLVRHDLNGKIAFTRGPLVLARDQEKEGGAPDLTEPCALAAETPTFLPPDDAYGELLRLTLPRTDGSALLLTDYASCGKHWDKENARMTVWMND